MTRRASIVSASRNGPAVLQFEPNPLVPSIRRYPHTAYHNLMPAALAFAIEQEGSPIVTPDDVLAEYLTLAGGRYRGVRGSNPVKLVGEKRRHRSRFGFRPYLNAHGCLPPR